MSRDQPWSPQASASSDRVSVSSCGNGLVRPITGMKALSKNGFRYPFPQYGVQQDVRAGMAVSYPGRK